MWGGACTSSIGTEMQRLAQSWLVLQISGSPFLLGLDSFLGESPVFLFALFSGAVADRRDRRHLLIASQMTQMTCAFLLAALFATGVIQVWHILALSLVGGLGRAFGAPAYQALVPTLVKTEDLSNAIALNSIQFNVARVIGPVLGGLALTGLGATWCFLLNGLSFIAVITSLLMLEPRFVPSKSTDSILESMKDGIKFIRRQGAMESLIAVAFCITALAIPLIVFLPVFARDVFRKGPSVYTLLLSTSGFGSIVGAIAVAYRGHAKNMGRDTLLRLILLGGLMAAFGVSKSLPFSCVLIFLFSAALVSVFAMVNSLVQTITPDAMRGRVMSVYNVAFRGGMPLGSLTAGSLVNTWTAPVVIAVNGIVLTGLGLYFLLVHRRIATL